MRITGAREGESGGRMAKESQTDRATEGTGEVNGVRAACGGSPVFHYERLSLSRLVCCQSRDRASVQKGFPSRQHRAVGALRTACLHRRTRVRGA